MAKPKKIGNHQLGQRNVDIYVDGVTPGGYFSMSPPGGGPARITIGLDQTHWSMVMSVLVHESMELSLAALGARYVPQPEWANNSASYQFMMDHQVFAEACAHVGYLVTQVAPDLSKAYKAFKRKK